jgi:adenylate kinase
MAEEFDLEHASTGDIFRAAVAEESELGQTVQSYLDGGKLVPDELTSRVVEEMVLERHDDFILDGFPRTIPQAELLDQMLDKRDENLDGVLYFELSEEDAVERLTGRLVCSECGKNYHRSFMPPEQEGICDECGGELHTRSDSSEEIVRKRLEEYDQKTRPLVPYYEEQGLLETIDASAAPNTVSQLTRDTIQELG